MNIYDAKNNITVINLLSKNCLNRNCYVPRIASHNENIEYVCGRRELRGCPEKHIEEELNRYPWLLTNNKTMIERAKKKAKAKWNKNADKYNQWDSLGQDEKNELIQEVIND